MTSTLRSIKTLNNRAVALVATDDARGAFEAFQQTVHVLKAVWTNVGVVGPSQGESLYPMVSFCGCESRMKGCSKDSELCYYVFDRLIVFIDCWRRIENKNEEEDGSSLLPAPEEYLALSAAICFFNVAQVYFFHDGTGISLERAVDFYGMSLRLLDTVNADAFLERQSDVVDCLRSIRALAIVTFNNMAIAYQELGLFQKSMCCLKELSRQIDNGIVDGQFDQAEETSSGECFMLDVEDVVGFHLNTMMIDRPLHSPAA